MWLSVICKITLPLNAYFLIYAYNNKHNCFIYLFIFCSFGIFKNKILKSLNLQNNTRNAYLYLLYVRFYGY
jgi:hypothetical protein